MPDPPQHAPSGEHRLCPECNLSGPQAIAKYEQSLLADHAPSGEPAAAVVLGVGEGRFSPGPLFDVGWNSRQPEIDGLRAELAQVWQQRDRYLEQRNQARQEVARLNREIATFDRTAVPVPHDHVRIEGCYRCVWPDDEQLRASGQGE